MMVDTPGDSDAAITVGAYNCRSSWENMSGSQTTYNILVSDIALLLPRLPPAAAPSSPTSPRRDHDLVPRRRQRRGAKTAAMSTRCTSQGRQTVAWQGTSARDPVRQGSYRADAQNPKLTSGQIKGIITRPPFTTTTPAASRTPSRATKSKLAPEAASCRSTLRNLLRVPCPHGHGTISSILYFTGRVKRDHSGHELSPLNEYNAELTQSTRR